MAWRLAMWPTRRLPVSVRATIDGVVLYPPRLGMTTGLSFSTMVTHEFVVPRSMLITRSMNDPLVGSFLLQALRHFGYPIILRRDLTRLLEFPFGCEGEPR